MEEIEKPPFEINDNTDDVMEPKPASIQAFHKQPMPPSRRSQEDSYLASDVVSQRAAAALVSHHSVRSSIEYAATRKGSKMPGKGPPPQLHNLGSGGSGEPGMGPSGQGYISDYYLKQGKPSGKRAFDGGTGSGNDDHSDDNSHFQGGH